MLCGYLAEGVGGDAVHNVFKLGQLLLADAGEQLPAHGDDAALDLIEQRPCPPGSG